MSGRRATSDLKGVRRGMLMVCGTSAARMLPLPFIFLLVSIFELVACQVHASDFIDPIAHGPAFVLVHRCRINISVFCDVPGVTPSTNMLAPAPPIKRLPPLSNGKSWNRSLFFLLRSKERDCHGPGISLSSAQGRRAQEPASPSRRHDGRSENSLAHTEARLLTR